MPGCNKDDEATRNRARENLSKSTDPLDKLRNQCLCRGASGIKGLGRAFRIADDNRDKQLDKEEFFEWIHDYQVDLSKEEIDQLFVMFDKDGSGKLSYDEFLDKLRPPMSDARKRIIRTCFEKMDATGDGVITIEDLKRKYKAREHPKYKNGEWTEDQVFREFLKSFGDDNNDHTVTWEEFLNYYAGVSLSIDTDTYFDLMMRNAYKI